MLLITLSRLSHDQVMIFLPFSSCGIAYRSFFRICIPMTGIPSSLAHLISHREPLECQVLLLNSTIMPSQPLIFVLQRACHSDCFQGCFTDMSINSNGVFSLFACFTRKSLYCTSFIAKLMKMRFF